MVNFVFNIRSELEIFEYDNLIQKRKPVIHENHLVRGIQSKNIRGLEAEPMLGSVGGQSPLTWKNSEFVFKSWMHYEDKIENLLHLKN